MCNVQISSLNKNNIYKHRDLEKVSLKSAEQEEVGGQKHSDLSDSHSYHHTVCWQGSHDRGAQQGKIDHFFINYYWGIQRNVNV